MPSDLVIVEEHILATRDAFEAVAIDPSINFQREAGFAVQLLQGNEYALKIAKANPQAVINAVTNIAAIGISLNPATKHAYLIPRDGKIVLDISYRGMLHLAIASGSLRWGQAEIVHQADTFVVGGYAEATTMPIAEVWGIRDRSESWKSHVAKNTKTPWASDTGEMVKKTVIKRAYKTWPMSERVQKAGHILDTDGGEGFGNDADLPEAPAEILAPAKAAAAGGRAEFAKHWEALTPVDREALRPHIGELQKLVVAAEKEKKA
jgi:recombination protein RecT